MAMKDPQERTKRIIKEDIETIRAYADCFGVEMPDLDENGEVVGLPAPYPREVAGVVRSGYRIYELGQKAIETGIPCLNPILGRNSAEETWKESNDIHKYAEKFGQTVFQFVHSEATRHIDPLKGRELIEQSRGKGGITPKGEREFIQMGGGAKHPVRINATGDTAHINILNGFIAGFDGTDIGPVIHVHFGGRGIHDFRTKVVNGYKACEICGENKIFAQLDTHKHINNIGGTDGMAIAMCLLSEGLAYHAGLPWELSGIQMNVGGNNLYRDLAIMRAFRHNMLSKSLIVVPETFQNPPANLIAEQAHFARMAISAKLGGANFYRPKAAESVGIPTGDSMGQACWATLDVFQHTYNPGIESPKIDEYENMMMDEAFAMTRTWPCNCRAASCRSSVRRSASASSSRARCTRNWPVAVVRTPRLERSNNAVPVARSSAVMRPLTAPSANPARSLPALMEPLSATATMTRNVVRSGGSKDGGALPMMRARFTPAPCSSAPCARRRP